LLRLPFRLRPLFWSIAVLAAPIALPTAAAAQQTEVEDTGTIDDFRLDQPAGPGTPVRAQPPVPVPTPPQPQPSVPANIQAQPTIRPAARPATPKPTQRVTPLAPVSAQQSTAAPNTAPIAATPPIVGETASPALSADEGTLPAVSETIPDFGTADDGDTKTPASDPTSIDAAPPQAADWASYWAYALGTLAVVFFGVWLLRRRNASGGAVEETAIETVPAEAPVLDLTEPMRPALSRPALAASPERKGPPPGTIGVSAAKLFGVPPAPTAPRPTPSANGPSAARPSASSQGFVTTRAPLAEPRPAAPSGTVGIPASRIMAPESSPPPIELVEGTKLAAQFSAPELIRDADGLRLSFALGIGNMGDMAAKDVRIRTVLLTAAADSDRAIGEWMANPNGPAAATIAHIDGGTQTNITGEIQLNADQIRAMSMQGQAIFVPMFAISIDFLGAEGLDRFGEAYVIGLPPERMSSNGAARVLPLPHDEKLPRRWTDLVHSRANIGG
jgi:hypothetical protein